MIFRDSLRAALRSRETRVIDRPQLDFTPKRALRDCRSATFAYPSMLQAVVDDAQLFALIRLTSSTARIAGLQSDS